MEKTHDVRHVDTELMHYGLGWLAAIGLGLILTGMTALYAPYYSNFSLRSLIGSFFLVSGALFIAHAFWSPPELRFAQEFLIGLLYLLFAMLILGFAGREGETLTLFLSIFLCLEGIRKIFFSLRLRPKLDWTWALISGVVSLIIGAVIWGGYRLEHRWSA